MILELDLPEKLIRKIKALQILTGGGSAASLEEYVILNLERVVDESILKHLTTEPTLPIVRRAAEESREPVRATTYSYLDDRLGDEEDYEEVIPKKKTGSLTADMLDADMDIGDSEHESTAEAINDLFPKDLDMDADEIFSKISGIPVVSEEPVEIDHRILKRKKRGKLPGKVMETEDV